MSDHRNSPVAGIRRENLSIPVALDAVAGTL